MKLSSSSSNLCNHKSNVGNILILFVIILTLFFKAHFDSNDELITLKNLLIFWFFIFLVAISDALLDELVSPVLVATNLIIFLVKERKGKLVNNWISFFKHLVFEFDPSNILSKLKLVYFHKSAIIVGAQFSWMIPCSKRLKFTECRMNW